MTHTPFVPDVDPRYVITRQVTLPAPVDRVWRAISVADEIARWFPNESAELSALEPGGTGMLTWKGDESFPIVIEVVEAPTYLAWTWGHETDAVPTTLVEWQLERTSDGGTLLTVTESGIRTPERFADNSQGWREELGQLLDYLTAAVAP
jgi:uncharacterized protein YndB with AHSA1/START domain